MSGIEKSKPRTVKNRDERRNLIKEYIRKRYTIAETAEKLGLHERTVYRELSSMRSESKFWFDELATEAFIHEYHETIKILDQTIKDCHNGLERLEKRTSRLQDMNEELLGTIDIKKPGTSALILQNLSSLEGTYQSTRQNYLKLIEDCTQKRGQLIHKGPMIYAIEAILKKGNIDGKITTPKLHILEKLNEGEDNEQG